MSYPVEIKANVEPSAIDSALSTLKLADSDAEERSIYFLDTSRAHEPLVLYAQGVILRIRCGVGGDNDCTVKFRPCRLAQLPTAWKEPSTGDGWEYRLEEDWTGDHRVLSASLVVDREDAQVEPAVRGEDPSAVFADDQLELFHGYTSHDLQPKHLRLLGPVRARKWKTKVRGHKIYCEEWDIDARLRFLELSGRADDADAAQVSQQQLLDLYESLGVPISATPELKTKLVLDHFSKTAHPS
ncbi:hypothetical protein OG555_19220 [Kribbella sp. NBC_01484]|uniref:hypothetical protein n=1 Tax=Kribbella sp. NBC_01484 TaxID=2903579 RepID=UPI002E3063E6|nr:hypothetical protein [Kribbella sp. NBC_01484]